MAEHSASVASSYHTHALQAGCLEFDSRVGLAAGKTRKKSVAGFDNFNYYNNNNNIF